MISKLTKALTQFYQVSLIVIMVATMGTIFYFWKLGFIDGSRSQELHQANYILEQYQQKNPLGEIEQIVFNEDSKLAINKLKAFESDFEKIDKLIEVNEFDNVVKETQQLKKAIANLISFPKIEKVLGVFNDKLEKFYHYVDSNNWRTLTRSGQRILTQTKGEINKNSIHNLTRSIQNELETMDKVTENSLLSRAEKQEIISRINNLRIETNMLNKYVDERHFFYELLKNYKTTVSNWINIVNPDLSLLKLQSEQVGRYYVMGLLGILILTTIVFLGSFVVNRLVATRSQQQVEKRIKHYIQDNIISEMDDNLDQFSDEFQTFTHQTAKYVNKRMSFGSIFQDTLPIGSILLDHNLKVIWANQHFADQWQIAEEELNREYLSWDYLAKLTNIGEDDPVLEALKNGIAGIYQVQIKVNEKEPVRPFEMYVSPVKYNNQNRVQLYFYPLSSLQKTITDQAMSIVGPVARTLDLMLKGDYDDHYKEQLYRDYEIAGIMDIQAKFNELELLFKRKEGRMIDELEVLHVRLEKWETTIKEINEINKKIQEQTREQIGGLRLFKDSVIGLSQLGTTFEQNSVSGIKVMRKMLSNIAISLQTNNKLSEALKDISTAIPDMEKTKLELKDQKGQVNEIKTNLYHSISQLVHIKKKIHDPSLLEKFEQNFNKLNSEFKLLDQSTEALDKKITSIELMLSKSEMFLNDAMVRAQELSRGMDNTVLDEFSAQINTIANAVKSPQGQISKLEDEIVMEMRKMFTSTKTNTQLTHHAEKTVSPLFVSFNSDINTVNQDAGVEHTAKH